MKLLANRVANALSFAHLVPVRKGESASVTAAAAAAADDDKDDDKDDKASARAKADDDSGDDDQARADDPSAGDDDEEDKDKKGKRAKAADDEPKKKDDDSGEDDDEEMRGKSAIARARLREQARCAEIMGCRAAGRNVVLAAQLALTTRLTRTEAIAMLETTPSAAPVGQGREARNPKLGSSGGDVTQHSAAAISASWERAFEKAGASRRK